MSLDEQAPDAPAHGLTTSPEQDPSRATAPVGLGALGWARWAWRQLTSMRTALLLLFLLVLAAVPGSVLPQRRVDAGAVRGYLAENPDLGPWLDRLGFFDVFSSVWFSAIYLLLFVSLVGCVLPRSRQHLRALRARPPAAPRRLERLPEHRRLVTTAPPEAVLAGARHVLRRSRYRVVRDGSSVAGERGYLRETGNLVFHLALLAVLVAFAAGHLYGFRGNVVVLEGGGFSNTLGQYDTVDVGGRFDESVLPPFTLSLEDLAVRYQEHGAQQGEALEFGARVSYESEPGAPTRTAVVAPNHPLELDGTKVFLTGNGYAPRFTVRDAEGEVLHEGGVPFLPQDGFMTSHGVLKVSAGDGDDLGFPVILLPTAPLDTEGRLAVDPAAGRMASVFPDLRAPMVFLTAYAGELNPDNAPQSRFHLDTSAMDQLAAPDDPGRPLAISLSPGESAELPDGRGTITFDGVDRFANFQVARDPGRLPALAGAVLAIGALMLSLFVRRRRVWVRAEPAPDGTTVVEVAALSRTAEDGLAAHVDDLAARLDERLDEPPAAAAPAAQPLEKRT